MMDDKTLPWETRHPHVKMMAILFTDGDYAARIGKEGDFLIQIPVSEELLHDREKMASFARQSLGTIVAQTVEEDPSWPY